MTLVVHILSSYGAYVNHFRILHIDYFVRYVPPYVFLIDWSRCKLSNRLVYFLRFWIQVTK